MELFRIHTFGDGTDLTDDEFNVIKGVKTWLG